MYTRYSTGSAVESPGHPPFKALKPARLPEPVALLGQTHAERGMIPSKFPIAITDGPGCPAPSFADDQLSSLPCASALITRIPSQ